MKYVKPEILSLKSSQEFNEKWLQARIEEDPSILGLGDLDFRDSEKMLVGGGRLDTILYDPEYKKRYEVEIQLGKTDESHIIRTIEYWDIERRRNPQYDHCAVIVAEDITSRFLNVISLFNGFIPIVAIQVKAVKVGDAVSLFFTKVLDEVRFDLHESDSESETTNREYWERKASKESLKLTDKLMQSLSPATDDYNLKYNKHYIGMARNNIANNFVAFVPRKSVTLVHIKHEKTDVLDAKVDESDLDTLSYDKQWNQYRFRLKKSDLENEASMSILREIAVAAKSAYHG